MFLCSNDNSFYDGVFVYVAIFFSLILNFRLVCNQTFTSDGMIVGYLPGEISRITKFFLDRIAVMQVELTSKDY